MATETQLRDRPDEKSNKPRIGVPWRSTKEEAAGNRPKIENYLRAVSAAAGEPVLISLATPPAALDALIKTLDAFVLPGSPSDVDPARYGAKRHPKCADPDPQREKTDDALLHHAFAVQKPVLAICYGVQLLNVHLGGTLLQDIPSEMRTDIRHDKNGLPSGALDPRHRASIEGGSKLAALSNLAELAESGFSAEVNSSHHQAIRTPGRGLRIVARAPDGVIEAVEWTGDGPAALAASAHWVIGVQWHPERMSGDWLAESLLRGLVATARKAVSGVRS